MPSSRSNKNRRESRESVRIAGISENIHNPGILPEYAETPPVTPPDHPNQQNMVLGRSSIGKSSFLIHAL